MGKIDGPDRPPGVAREGQADGHVPLAHLDDLIKDLLVGALTHMHDVIEHQAEVEGHEARQGAGGPGAEDVDLLGVDDGIHRRLEALPVDFLHGHANFFHVRLHDGRDHVLVADDVVGHLDPLDGREPVANHFLQCFLHGGVAVIFQLRCEAHHGGFADVDGLAQLAGGHKGRLVIGGQNVIGNELLSLGKGIHFAADER